MRRSAVAGGHGAALLLVLAATACGGEQDAGCDSVTAMPSPPAIGDRLAADRLGTVVAGQEAEGFTTMTIESDHSIDELQRRLPAALARLGMQPLSVDDEGFETEIYFGGNDASASALAKVTESTTCSGRTTIVLSVSDPSLSGPGS